MIFQNQRHYDVTVLGIDAATGLAVLKLSNGQVIEHEHASPLWSVGARGVLEITTRDLQFWTYAEPSLKRTPHLDRQHPQLGEIWAWAIEGVTDPILTRPHFVPGLGGRYIADLTEPQEVAIPPEFVDLCQQRGVTAEHVLKAFMADLCALQSSPALPREDGFCSQGVAEQVKALSWFEQAFGPKSLAWDTTQGD